jgi:signal transduction histidine kinase
MSHVARTAGLAAAVAAMAVAGSLVTSAALGMGASQTAHIAASLLPAAAATVLGAVAAPRVLRRAPTSTRFVSVAVIAIVIALANVAVLAFQMVVRGDDAKILAILLVYALGAGTAVALALNRSTAAAFDRLDETVRAFASGDLSARTGRLDAEREIDALASTLDEMGVRLDDLRGRERHIETTRRDLMMAVSHDLRTPLASLRAMVEAVDDGVVRDPDTVRRYVREMRASVGQLSSMVDDLFELSQLDAGAIETETRRMRLDDIVGSVLASIEPHALEKGLVLHADLGGAADVVCSPRMTRVLHNLLVNAVRHTPADGSVSVLARCDGDHVEITVEDSGEGVPAEDVERIFEPFYRGDPARSGPGAGLGLTLAKRIVEGVGGSISVRARAAGGGHFSVLLPVQQ